MSESNIVVLISGNGSNLQAIIDACERGRVQGKVVGVISNKADVYGLERAKNHNIPGKVVDHKAFDSREAYDKELAAAVEAFKPAVVVLAGFMRILTAEFVEQFSGRLINIHPSLLPSYQGLDTHQRAIDAGDEEHGCSVHFVNQELDGGPIILQAKVPIFEEDTVEELAARVQVQEHAIYPIVVNWLCEKRLRLHEGQVYLDDKLLSEQGYADD